MAIHDGPGVGQEGTMKDQCEFRRTLERAEEILREEGIVDVKALRGAPDRVSGEYWLRTVSEARLRTWAKGRATSTVNP